MKVVINKLELVKALKIVNRVFDPDAPRPELRYAKLDIGRTHAQLTVIRDRFVRSYAGAKYYFENEFAIITKVGEISSDVWGISILLPVKELLKFLKTIKSEFVILEHDPDAYGDRRICRGQLTLRDGKFTVRFPSPTIYPTFEVIPYHRWDPTEGRRPAEGTLWAGALLPWDMREIEEGIAHQYAAESHYAKEAKCKAEFDANIKSIGVDAAATAKCAEIRAKRLARQAARTAETELVEA